MKHTRTKGMFIYFLIFIALIIYGFFTFFYEPSPELDFNQSKSITLNDNGLIFKIQSSAENIEQFLEEQDIQISNYDLVFPSIESPLCSGEKIIIARAIKFELQVDNQNIERYSTAKTIDEILSENKIVLSKLDKVSPEIHLQPHDEEVIIVIRINIEEKTIEESIPFKTTQQKDSNLSWREERIEQKGVLGKIATKYKITYKNGIEISRVALEKNVLQDPTTEIITQGTYMKLGKAERGDGTYYNASWGELNASRTIKRGEYAKVTNMDNGKSVIIKINDYGPQSPERIIDMSYNSFSKIADPSQGVMHNVKVEPVLN